MTGAAILTRCAGAVVNVDVTVRPFVAKGVGTVARVRAQPILAEPSILTWTPQTVVDVEIADYTLKEARALARVGGNPINTRAAIETRR